VDRTLVARRFRIPSRWIERATVPAIVVAAASLPLLSDSSFELARLELVFVYLTAAIALNFAFGYGGQLALGQPLLIASAAYVAGILSSRWGWEFWATTPVAMMAAVVVSLLLGLPSLRVRGWYLAIITVFAVSIFPDLVLAFRAWTNGTDGVIGILPIRFGGTPAPTWLVYELILAAPALSLLAVRNLTASGWGIALRTTRHHPIAAASVGVNLMAMRAWIYTLSALPCGIAGALFAHSQQYISTDSFGAGAIFLLIGSVFLGGPGTLLGPILGVALFEGLTLYIGPFSPYNPLILGVGVLLSALVFRGGIVRVVESLWASIAPTNVPAIRLDEARTVRERITSPIRQPRLDIRGVDKRFSGNVALQKVDLEVVGGRITAVVGPNGSGKTTLLNVICGFVKPDAGSVILNDRDVTRQPVHLRARSGVGRTFQVPKLVDGLSIARNVELGVVGAKRSSVGDALFRLPGYPKRERERVQKAIQACVAVGFRESELQTRVGYLSLGLKRLVEVARVLAGDATVVCLDEPVAGLNSEERSQVASVAKALAASGRAVLLIEHNLPFVLSVCDDLILLQDGKVADRGDASAARDESRTLGRYFQTFVAREVAASS
jgi:branched-chain amino acid transport system permease protein